MQEEALRTSCRIPDKGEVAASRGDYAFILTLYLCVQVGNCSNYIAPGMCITDSSILKTITLCQSSYKGLDRIIYGILTTFFSMAFLILILE